MRRVRADDKVGEEAPWTEITTLSASPRGIIPIGQSCGVPYLFLFGKMPVYLNAGVL